MLSVSRLYSVDVMVINGYEAVPGEHLPLCNFVHHKSYMNWPGIEDGPPRWKAC
jgi:hypothetical protein